MSKKILPLISLLCLLSLLLCSCSISFSDEGTFYGGQILDDALLAEIRQDVLGKEDVTSSTKDSVAIGATDSKAETPSEQKSTEGKDEPIENTPSTDGETVLYWVENGEVWHTSKDCRYLKNKEIISGSQDDAVADGKKRICSACENK